MSNMINLKARSEYSFRKVVGSIEEILSISNSNYCCLTDTNSTWAIPDFLALCKKNNKKPIIGVELFYVEDVNLKIRRRYNSITVIAKNEKGLAEIYKQVSIAYSNKYYEPLLELETVSNFSDNVFILFSSEIVGHYLMDNKNAFLEISPTTGNKSFTAMKNFFKTIAVSDNLMVLKNQKKLREVILSGKFIEERANYEHLLTREEWKNSILYLTEEEKEEALNNQLLIANNCDPKLQIARLPKTDINKSLKDMCLEGLCRRKLDKNDKVYLDRIDYELSIIKTKDYENYFYIVSDLVIAMKKELLVGPARGSSAGSLVCYLLEITDVDPLEYGLSFERFLDINKTDLPDIDIDIEDSKRLWVLKYLKNKYGGERVSGLGTINKYQINSSLNETAKAIKVKEEFVNKIKENIKGSLAETFTKREILSGCQEMEIAKDVEGRVRHSGKHPAAIVLADRELYNFCPIDTRSDNCLLEKKQAEAQGLLKIDILGLRTLTLLSHCLGIIGKSRQWLLDIPLNDIDTFKNLNDGNFAGIFQFEGSTLKNLCNKINLTTFNDLVIMTSIARPGPLNSGQTEKYIKIKNGEMEVSYLPGCEEITRETLGIIIYQEQIMSIAREVGGMNWADVSKVRKAMSGDLDVMKKLKSTFIDGSIKNGLKGFEALEIWQAIEKSGSVVFNKSHAVSYSFLSYYCAYLKTHFLKEFILSTLLFPKHNGQVVSILLELKKNKIPYSVFNKAKSQLDWSIIDGVITGGFKNIIGLGSIKAKSLLKKRDSTEGYNRVDIKKVMNARTPYDFMNDTEIYEKVQKDWGKYFEKKPITIEDINNNSDLIDIRFCCSILDFDIRKKKNGKGSYIKGSIFDNTGSAEFTISSYYFKELKNKHNNLESYLKDNILRMKGKLLDNVLIINKLIELKINK